MGSRPSRWWSFATGQIIGQPSRWPASTRVSTARQAMEAALRLAGVARRDVERVVATGAGREEAPGQEPRGHGRRLRRARGGCTSSPTPAPSSRSGPRRAARSAATARPRCSTSRSTRSARRARARSPEAMTRALEVSVEELGPLSLESENAISINAQCVCSPRRGGLPDPRNVGKADVGARRARRDGQPRPLHGAPGGHRPDRFGDAARRPGPQRGVRDSLRRNLSIPALNIPADPELSGALGPRSAATRA